MNCEASCARYMRRMCIIYLIEIPYVVSPKVDRRRNDPSSCTMSPVYGRFSILASFSPQIIPQRSARADRIPATCVKVRGLSRDPRLPPLRLRIHGMNWRQVTDVNGESTFSSICLGRGVCFFRINGDLFSFSLDSRFAATEDLFGNLSSPLSQIHTEHLYTSRYTR